MPLTVASVLVQGIVKLTTTSRLAGILGLQQWWNEDKTPNKWNESNANGRIFRWFDGKWMQYVGSGIDWNPLSCFYEVKIFWCTKIAILWLQKASLEASTFPRGPRVGPGMATTLAAIWCISSLHLNSPMPSIMVIQPGTFAKIHGTWWWLKNRIFQPKNMHLWNITQLDPWLVSNLLSQIGFPKLGASFHHSGTVSQGLATPEVTRITPKRALLSKN